MTPILISTRALSNVYAEQVGTVLEMLPPREAMLSDVIGVFPDIIALEERALHCAQLQQITVLPELPLRPRVVFNALRLRMVEQLHPPRQARQPSVIVTLDTDLVPLLLLAPSITKMFVPDVLPDIPSQRPARHLLHAPRVHLVIIRSVQIKPRALSARAEVQRTELRVPQRRVLHVPPEIYPLLPVGP